MAGEPRMVAFRQEDWSLPSAPDRRFIALSAPVLGNAQRATFRSPFFYSLHPQRLFTIF